MKELQSKSEPESSGSCDKKNGLPEKSGHRDNWYRQARHKKSRYFVYLHSLYVEIRFKALLENNVWGIGEMFLIW